MTIQKVKCGRCGDLVELKKHVNKCKKCGARIKVLR